MSGYVVVKHNDEGHETVVARYETAEEAQQARLNLKQRLPYGSSTYFTVHDATYEVIPLRSDDQFTSGPRAVPKNCNDIRREVAKQPYRAGERAYIIKKAIELGCIDNIPEGWMIQFRRMKNE